MALKDKAPTTPPLISFSSYTSFLNDLREHGAVPARIDKTLMSKASGSQSSGMIAAMKYLGQIDDLGKPSDSFKQLILASDEARPPMLSDLLKERYTFIFSDESFDLQQGTSGQMAEKFRSLDINGSTLTKTIAFFLAMAKAAGVKVSPHIKAPSQPKGNNGAKKPLKRREDESAAVDMDDDDLDDSAHRFEIPIPGKTSVKVIVPMDLDADDWEMLQSMITVYIKRWKNFRPQEPQ
ncbi:DUF5343 domain-containing protein [Polaromonas sp. SM01]|uniref:DUF5343 domain-containing protein n=1 Tax=Polaromonas sp. SM01 TaxID=3085630 RepID=UPI002982853A|nr:DUF5343 domain-containing protein [Polaromonas sp. SM01]MDW5443673.1 DUF5343 domain-containing protein [Polaromonas sp. SM01]